MLWFLESPRIVRASFESTCAGTNLATNWIKVPSCRRKPVGGFTFEVQQIPDEYLSRGIVVKTLSWSVIIGTEQGQQARIRERGQICLSRQAPTHATDAVLDAALLPGRMSITEKGPHR